MKTPLFFLILLLLPVATAFDCSKLGNSPDCLAAQTVDENLIANLLYTNTTHPDHVAIAAYNSKIIVTAPPSGYQNYTSGVIHNAWITLLTVQPSVLMKGMRYCPANISVRNEYNYTIILLTDYYGPQRDGGICKILYYRESDTPVLTTYANNRAVGTGKNVTIKNLQEDAIILADLNIQAVTRSDQYSWRRYCCRWGRSGCRRYCWDCPRTSTNYKTDTLRITDATRTTYYVHQPNASITLSNYSSTTTKGTLYQDKNTSVWLAFVTSNYSKQQYEYSANFTKKPFYFLELSAIKRSQEQGQNLLWNNNSFYLANASNCTLRAEDFFQSRQIPCTSNNTAGNTSEEIPSSPETDWSLLFKIIVFLFVSYLIYVLARKYWRKFPGIFLALVLAIPFVRAEECGLTNLASCLPEKMYDYFLSLINAPLEPLLSLVKMLLTNTPSIELFGSIWAIIVYSLSFFYALLFLYAGYQFLTSGHNVLKREMAKEWLKNIIIMIVLVQGSFYFYGLVADLGNTMTSAVLSLVDPQFFLITADNITNIGLEFLFVGMYVLILFFTVLLLMMRYMVVAFGVLFAPIGLFCYFLPPLKSYGKLILHICGVSIFVTFLDAIIILACSKLILLPLFANMKILVMINCFLIVDITFLILIMHVLKKSSFSDGAESLAQTAKYIAMLG